MTQLTVSNLLDAHVRISLTNNMDYLRGALVDADNGAIASIYKRGTEEVDFMAMTRTNVAENDLNGFGYGIATINDEGEAALFAAEEDGTNAYLKGKDRRLIDRDIPEELEHRFGKDGYEIIDMQTVAEFVEKNRMDYLATPEKTRSFTILAENLHLFLEKITEPAKKKGMKHHDMAHWVNCGLIHMQPFVAHNPSRNEWVCLLVKPDMDTDYYVAKVPVIRNGQNTFEEYEVDMTRSRQESDELPTDEDLLDHPNGVPMYGTSHKVSVTNDRGVLEAKEYFTVQRPFERGVRIAAQDLGPSGMRLPLLPQNNRPVSVTANSKIGIEMQWVDMIPFAPSKKPNVVDAYPFTIGVDDLVRVARLFEPDDMITVTYFNMLDRENGFLPVRFESSKTFDTRDENNHPHYLEKVAMVTAVRPIVNGKVVFE